METDNNITEKNIKAPELLSQILDSVGSPVFVKDRKHRWVHLNKAFCELMNRRREELIGKSDHDFFPKEQADLFWAHDDQAFAAGGETMNDESFTDSAGNLHATVTRKQIYKNAAGEDVLVGVIHDITALKKANDELTLFRRLLENSNDAIFIINPEDGSFLDMNETACSRLGYPRKTLLRMGVADIQTIVASSFGTWEQMREKIMAAGTLLIEGWHIRADSTSFPVEVSINRAEIGGKMYVLAAARDITERRKLEAAIKETDLLRGLIPICAKCKKIRDDKGFWEKVEDYLEKHAGARFTHGLCKDCMKELYGKENWFKETK